MSSVSSHLESFYRVSEILTGFSRSDLMGTGAAPEYLSVLTHGAGLTNVEDLLGKALRTRDSERAVRETVWPDPRTGPLARRVIFLWYLGTWVPLPEPWHEEFGPPATPPMAEHIVSRNAYIEGLVWPAIGVNTRGAKPSGFASWGSLPGLSLAEESEGAGPGA